MPPACPTVHDWHLYELGALEPTRRAALDAHLVTCPTCQAVLAELAEVDTALVDLHAEFAPQPAAREALMAALPRYPLRRARRGSLRPLVRVAAAVVVLVGAGWWLTIRPDSSSNVSERQLAESQAVVEFVLGHARDTLERMPVGLGGLPLNGGGPG